MSYRIIGIHGKAGSGKDTVALYLARKFDYQKYGFADPLKTACMEAFGLSELDVYTEEGKKEFNEFWKVTHRAILQFVGTELFREGMEKLIPGIKDTFWLRRATQEFNHRSTWTGQNKFVICDLRFVNECDWVVSHQDSFVIHLVGRQHITLNGIDGHASEATLDLSHLGDKVIEVDNSGTLENLYDTLDDVMAR